MLAAIVEIAPRTSNASNLPSRPGGKAVNYPARVSVISRDFPFRVDARGYREGRARTIEVCEGAVATAQEAVDADGVNVISRDRTRRIDA